MASVSFYYRSKNDNSNISIRLIHKNIDYTLRTPYVSQREYWIYKTTNKGKAITRHKKVEDLRGDAILKKHKEDLLAFKNRVEVQLQNDINNNIPITKGWFKETINKHHTVLEKVEDIEIESDKLNAEKDRIVSVKTKNLILEIIKEAFIKYRSNTDELKKFKTTHNWVKDYQEDSGIQYRAKDLNQKFVDEFKNWAIEIKTYKLSTTIGHLKRIKRAVEYVYLNDSDEVIEVHKQLQHLKFSSAKEREEIKDKVVVTLNFSELASIDELVFKDDNELREIQKCILIGCETGLRFSDFNQLNDSNLKKSIDSIEYWEFKVRKTMKWVQITKTERLNYLINKYGQPKTDYTDNDDIVLNRSLKKICRLAKINEVIEGDLNVSIEIDGVKTRRLKRGLYPKYKLITTRTFRRSFATNYYGKINVELIMQVTGHSTQKMLMEYINVHDDKNIIIGYKKMNEVHEIRKEGKLKKVK